MAQNSRNSGVRLAVPVVILLAGVPALAQQAGPPPVPLEEIHSEAVRAVETVISRGSWHLLGSAPQAYRIGNGTTADMTGKTPALALQTCTMQALRGFGSVERTISAAPYVGKRVRVTARMKMEGDGGNAIFYINFLGPEGRHLRQVRLSYSGGRTWQSREIVANVQENYQGIDIGMALSGTDAATVWMESVTIQVVDQDVPLNGQLSSIVYVSSMSKPIISCDGRIDGIDKRPG